MLTNITPFISMKHRTIKVLFLFCILQSCNLSDSTEDLPNGYFYVNEGRCYKYIALNSKKMPEFIYNVGEYKYDDNFIVIRQEDSLSCEKQVVRKDLDKFYIINTKEEKLFGPMNDTNFLTKFKALSLSNDLLFEER